MSKTHKGQQGRQNAREWSQAPTGQEARTTRTGMRERKAKPYPLHIKSPTRLAGWEAETRHDRTSDAKRRWANETDDKYANAASKIDQPANAEQPTGDLKQTHNAQSRSEEQRAERLTREDEKASVQTWAGGSIHMEGTQPAHAVKRQAQTNQRAELEATPAANYTIKDFQWLSKKGQRGKEPVGNYPKTAAPTSETLQWKGTQ